MDMMTERNGISAKEMLALTKSPLFAPGGFAFNQGFIEITGIALAPNGRDDRLKIIGEPGVVFACEYPLPNPGAADVYWYWPGADKSAFRLKIDVAATQHLGDFYRFTMDYGIDAPLEFERTTFLIPKNFNLLQNYPTRESMTRVQRYDTISSVSMKGVTDAWRIMEIARRYDLEEGPVLDWGVGHGRVARHINLFGATEVEGIDIDPQNIEWARSHLSESKLATKSRSSIRFHVGPLMPPTNLDSGKYALVYGISVMTHLTKSVQEAWLAEIVRIMKPGGLALLTFAGDASVAFASRYLNKDWMEEYQSTGFGPELPDASLVGVIETPDYYKNIKQTVRKAENICENYFDVLASHECMFVYQDLLVLRKRA